MKVALNLSTRPSLRQRYALLWTVPFTLGALVWFIYSVFLAAHNISEYHQRHRSLVNYQTRENALRAQEMAMRRNLDRPQFRELLREAGFVNALIDQKQFSLTELTAKVTKILPPQARLTTFSFSQAAGEPVVRLSVESSGQEALQTFVNNLEESPDFKEVTITQQGLEQKGGPAGPVTITCSARYEGGPLP